MTGPEQELKTWNQAAFGKLKSVSSQEKSPTSGKLTRYKGVLLSQVLEQAMESLPLERKAQVDLLILKNASGGQVLLPRSVVTKYPVMLALDGDKTSVVMPWTSKSRIMSEDLPIESYFVSDLTRIELSNYRERYQSVFLKRRTDPLAMRGEKLFRSKLRRLPCGRQQALRHRSFGRTPVPPPGLRRPSGPGQRRSPSQ